MRFILPLLAVAAAGCFPNPDIRPPMRPGSPPELKASTETARVIFLRPDRSMGKIVEYVLFDGTNMEALGISVTDSAFAADIAAGTHAFCPGVLLAGGVGSGPLSNAQLVAGRTYVFKLDVHMSHVELMAIRPGTADWKEVTAEVSKVRGAQFDPTRASFLKDKALLAKMFKGCVDWRKETSAQDAHALDLAEADGV